MTCLGPLPVSGPCSLCAACSDGLHAPGDPPTGLYCERCCPAEHGTAIGLNQRLVLEVAVQTLHTLGHAIPARFNAAKALDLCRIHTGDLPEELRKLL